jgi:hypothetical protein
MPAGTSGPKQSPRLVAQGNRVKQQVTNRASAESIATLAPASILLTFNLLAIPFHTAAWLAVLAWRAAACGATYRFLENIRAITAYVVFQDWPHLLQSIAAADLRPP